MITAIETSPNIGALGVNVDLVNCRVKVLFDQIFTTTHDIQNCLKNSISSNYEATTLLADPLARFSARIITAKDQVATIKPFQLISGLVIHEEARITIGSYNLIYVGGNQAQRFDQAEFNQEQELAEKYTRRQPSYVDTSATFERMTVVSQKDIDELMEIYQACFSSYLVPLDEQLIQTAASNSIFWVARNNEDRIVASAIGEHLKLGPLTLLEVSEVAAHPNHRVRGAATGCVKRVINEGKATLPHHVLAFMEARMWQNILGMCQSVGFKCFAGILHQHCIISTPPIFNSIPQTAYGSLAVCYAP